MKMKKINCLCVALIGATMSLSSCTEEVMNPEFVEASESSANTSLFRIHTRGDAVSSGRIYVFQDESCIKMLDTGSDGETTETFLDPGTYSIYAVGSDDLSSFNLPTQSAATPSSVITLATGQQMHDLLMGSQSVTLEKGVPQELELTLSRQVFRIEQVTVKDVPTEVTSVEINISSIYQAIQLNRTLTGETTSITIPLTHGDGQTWSAQPLQYAFPTTVAPIISISFTSATGTKTYTTLADSPIEANHKLQIEATYAEPLFGSFTARLLSADWDSQRSIVYDFTENNQANPVVGQKYMYYYVVSVNSEARTAVLLAKNLVKYETPAEGATESDWLTNLSAAMSTLPKPYRATTDWRLPTLAEAEIFTSDTSLFSGNTPYYFCLDNGNLNKGLYQHNSETPSFFHNTNYNADVKLRPVIDIAY